ncbi:MAG: indolepyruvate oxidoreductase subunit beta [Patescibacteria group bacterium]|nr:indolepyruvate oxidoreductase subunit beta [Patescibacteria group bacterium]
MAEFNLIINGVGGQGLITLLRIISLASQKEGYDIKTSELHGLSQRGGSVEVHIRFGKKIYSPLVPQGKANLVISLELQESLNGLHYSSPKTHFLINQYKTPTFTKDLSEKEILGIVKKISKNLFLIPASEICQKELGSEVVAGIYLLGLAFSKKLLPLKSDSIISAIKKIIPEKYRELNLKAFELARQSFSSKNLGG